MSTTADYILFWHQHRQRPSLKAGEYLGADGRVLKRKVITDKAMRKSIKRMVKKFRKCLNEPMALCQLTHRQ